MAARWGAVILAAGASRRMGTPKALLPWGKSTLLEHAVEQARAAGVDDIVVVLGPAIAQLRPQARTAFNPDPDSGPAASIRLGCQMLDEDLTAVLIQSVDQPTSARLILELFTALHERGADVAVPAYAGRRGHPMCVAARVLPDLRTLTDQDQGLRAVVRQHAHALVELAVDDQSVLWNLNDRAAYQRAKRTTKAAR